MPHNLIIVIESYSMLTVYVGRLPLDSKSLSYNWRPDVHIRMVSPHTWLAAKRCLCLEVCVNKLPEATNSCKNVEQTMYTYRHVPVDCSDSKVITMALCIIKLICSNIMQMTVQNDGNRKLYCTTTWTFLRLLTSLVFRFPKGQNGMHCMFILQRRREKEKALIIIYVISQFGLGMFLNDTMSYYIVLYSYT